MGAFLFNHQRLGVRVLDWSMDLEREKVSGDLKKLLIDVYQAQEDLIYKQQEALMRLLHENTEQENFISELMKPC